MARRQISMDEVIKAIEELEDRYGVPSDQRRSIIDGERCADEDLQLWDELVLVRDRVTARTA